MSIPQNILPVIDSLYYYWGHIKIFRAFVLIFDDLQNRPNLRSVKMGDFERWRKLYFTPIGWSFFKGNQLYPLTTSL
jgi:hypothetical protein